MRAFVILGLLVCSASAFADRPSGRAIYSVVRVGGHISGYSKTVDTGTLHLSRDAKNGVRTGTVTGLKGKRGSETAIIVPVLGKREADERKAPPGIRITVPRGGLIGIPKMLGGDIHLADAKWHAGFPQLEPQTPHFLDRIGRTEFAEGSAVPRNEIDVLRVSKNTKPGRYELYVKDWDPRIRNTRTAYRRLTLVVP